MKPAIGICLMVFFTPAAFTPAAMAQMPDASSGKPTANMPQSGPVTLPGNSAPANLPASGTASPPRAAEPRLPDSRPVAASGAAKGPEIVLPEMLAVQLPRGMTEIGPGDAPLRSLLAAAKCDGGEVTSDLRRKLGPGTAKVTWNCWTGAVGAGQPVSTLASRIFILPAGMIPVGVSKDENATGGNNAVHIVHDAAGRVHMIWQYSRWGSEYHAAFYRRALVAADGSLKFETEPLSIAGEGTGDWNAYPAIAISGTTVQVVWQGGGTVHTRRITSGPGGYTMGPVIDTGAGSGGRDVGPSVALDGKGGVHIATPGGVYAYSGDGVNFRTEQFPLPPNASVKTVSIAVDGAGAAHIAFTAPIRRPDPPGGKLGGYWQLRTVTRTASGWSDASDVLAHAPGWSEPHNGDDMLADWVRIMADRQGGLHLSWHGTTFTHKYANDTAFYAYKKPGGGWSLPVAMMRKDPGRGITFSYAPSLALDGSQVRAMVFYQVQSGGHDVGFDSVLASLKDGQLAGPMQPVTQFVAQKVAAKAPGDAIGSRFPALAPEVWHGPDGHAWLDVLETFQITGEPGGANVIVYQRLGAGGP